MINDSNDMLQVLTTFAELAMQPVVVMVAGHMGEVELAAVALSNSVSTHSDAMLQYML